MPGIGYKVELDEGFAYVDSYFDNPAHRLVMQRKAGKTSRHFDFDLVRIAYQAPH